MTGVHVSAGLYALFVVAPITPRPIFISPGGGGELEVVCTYLCHGYRWCVKHPCVSPTLPPPRPNRLYSYIVCTTAETDRERQTLHSANLQPPAASDLSIRPTKIDGRLPRLSMKSWHNTKTRCHLLPPTRCRNETDVREPAEGHRQPDSPPAYTN